MSEEKKSKVLLYVIIGLLLVGVLMFILVKLKNDVKENVNNTDNIITKFKYEATLNDNMINYNLKIIDGENLNGELYSMDGEWLSDLENGVAVINEIDYDKYDNFKIKVNDKVYEIEKK